VLMAAVKAGVGRETAHEAIRRHALDVAEELREHGSGRNDLLDRLAADPALRVDRSTIEQLITAPLEFTGAAGSQIAEVVDRVEKIAAEHPDAAAYNPAPIL
jgi:adenylosuccinate lyase